MDKDSSVYSGACHCGQVQFDVTLTNGLATASRCDCSFCRMRGAVAVTAPVGGMRITVGAELLTLYQFNTNTAKHYFCKTCGIYTYHQRRSNPQELGVNVACLNGVSPFDFKELPVHNGIAHPKDAPDAPTLSGRLRFVPAGPVNQG